MQVREIMSKPAVCCQEDDMLHIAAQLMWECDCGTIPVVNQEGTLTGIVTDRDICMATYTQGRAPQLIRAGDVMATVVYSCHEDDSVETAEQLMAERQVRRIPVVDDQIRPVGLLSINDVARHAAAAANKTRESEEKAVAQTMAAISQPRVEHAESTARATPNGTSSGGPRAAIH